jgi:hypothetical protein
MNFFVRRLGGVLLSLQMLNDAADVLIAFEHLLVVAAALLMRSRAHMFAHYAIQVPLSPIFLLPFYNIPEIQ